MHTEVLVCTYIYISLFQWGERERERERAWKKVKKKKRVHATLFNGVCTRVIKKRKAAHAEVLRFNNLSEKRPKDLKVKNP